MALPPLTFEDEEPTKLPPLTFDEPESSVSALPPLTFEDEEPEPMAVPPSPGAPMALEETLPAAPPSATATVEKPTTPFQTIKEAADIEAPQELPFAENARRFEELTNDVIARKTRRGISTMELAEEDATKTLAEMGVSTGKRTGLGDAVAKVTEVVNNLLAPTRWAGESLQQRKQLTLDEKEAIDYGRYYDEAIKRRINEVSQKQPGFEMGPTAEPASTAVAITPPKTPETPEIKPTEEVISEKDIKENFAPLSPDQITTVEKGRQMVDKVVGFAKGLPVDLAGMVLKDAHLFAAGGVAVKGIESLALLNKAGKSMKAARETAKAIKEFKAYNSTLTAAEKKALQFALKKTRPERALLNLIEIGGEAAVFGTPTMAEFGRVNTPEEYAANLAMVAGFRTAGGVVKKTLGKKAKPPEPPVKPTETPVETAQPGTAPMSTT